MSKNKMKELDVDFIGGQDPLTKEEEKTISEFIQSEKEKHNKKNLRNKSNSKN